MGRQRTVRAGLPGRGAQEADNLVAHAHVAHRRADGGHDTGEVLSDASQRAFLAASEPSAGVNDGADDFEGPRQSAEELVVDGVDAGGPHAHEHLSLSGCGERH